MDDILSHYLAFVFTPSLASVNKISQFFCAVKFTNNFLNGFKSYLVMKISPITL